MKENERIKLVRKTLELTQQELADILNVSKQYLSKVENGLTNLSREKIAFICQRFNVSSDWILLEKGEMLTKDRNDISQVDESVSYFLIENYKLDLFCKYLSNAKMAISSKYSPVLFEDIAAVTREIFLEDYSTNPHDVDFWKKALENFDEEKDCSKIFLQRILKAYEKKFV